LLVSAAGGLLFVAVATASTDFDEVAAAADDVRARHVAPPSPMPPSAVVGVVDIEDVATASEPLPSAEDDAPAPVRVRVPGSGVDADLIELWKRDDGMLEVPQDADDTGWWAGGHSPGERGPAVIVGHVDSYEGPGVFIDLGRLQPGDEVTVDREDVTSVTFAVTHAEWHRKDAFPTEAVYGATDAPSLRLVTCGGEFDRDARSYEENLIVFLEIVGWN
jgi:hypothetical protein